MGYYIPPWLTGQQQASIGDPNSDWSQASGIGYSPALTGAQPNIYAPQQTPYADAAPLSGGVRQTFGMTLSQLMNNSQFWDGLSALAGADKQKQTQTPTLRAPEPQVFDGRPYMPQLLQTPFYTVQRGYQGRGR